MEKLAVISCLLLLVEEVTAQTAQTERLLPQWLTGIIAISAFLFLVFVTILVKKAWCETSRDKTTESVRETEIGMTFTSSSDSASPNIREEREAARQNGIGRTKNGDYATRVDLVREKAESVRSNEYVVEDRGDYATRLDLIRSKDNPKAFDNPVVDNTESVVSSM